MKEMNKIIYGGAFNPPTIGHYEICKALINKFYDYELIIMPSNSHYQKKDLVSFINRFEMCEIMAKRIKQENDNCLITVSDYETKDNKFVGTVNTLRDFNHPLFVIGADSLNTLVNWIDGKTLIQENKFVVFPRTGYNIQEILERDIYKEYQDHFIIMTAFTNVDVSSTDYRDNFDRTKLLDEVNDYITKNDLYKKL